MKDYIKRNENSGQRMRDMELKEAFFRGVATGVEGEENFVGDSEIIALGGASNETKDRPLG